MRLRALLLLAIAACTKPAPGPTLTGIAPDRGPADRDVAVTISGDRLGPMLVTDFSRRAGSVLDTTFSARLGREGLRDVKLNEDGTLSATVPQGISPGTYDVVVTTPGGTVLELAGGYRVLAANELNDLVASFRFAPVAPQQVGVPFTITVTAVDPVGLTVEGFAGTAALTDLTGTVVPRQVGPFARGAWTGLVEIRALHAADVLTVTGTEAKTGSSNAFQVAPGAGTRLVFATPPRAAIAGACSGAVTVQSVDATSTPSPATADLPLTLGAMPSNGFALFADAACAVPLGMPGLAAGQSALTFHFSGTRAGAVLLSASAPGHSPAAQTETVNAGPPSRLVFTTADPTLNSGSCSADVTLQTRDAFDNPAPVALQTMIALDVLPAAGLELFASGGACGSPPITSLMLPSGASAGDFQLRGGAAGAFTVNATSAGLGTAMLRVRVNPAGFPTQLVIVSMPQTVKAGLCSGPLAVQSQDAAGNAVVTPGPLPVTLSASPAAGFELFSDLGCATPATMTTLGGASSTSIVYFRGMNSGAVTVTASSPGLQSGVQTQNITAGPASRLAFTSAAQTLRAGACSGALDVGLLDSVGNAATASAQLTVTLGATPSTGVTFFGDPGCSAPATTFDIAAGMATGRLYLTGTVATLETVDATSPGFTTAQQIETVTPAPPAAVVFTSAPQSVGVNTCSSAATVEVRDAFGNVSPVMAMTAMTLSAMPAAGFTFYADPGCTMPTGMAAVAAMGSTASFFFRGSALGPVTVTASPAGLMPASQGETIVAGAAVKLAFTTPARTAAAAACSAAVTVTVEDASDNPSPVPAARLVTLAAGGLSLFGDATCTTAITGLTIPVGQSSGTFFFTGTTAAAYAVTASSAGLTAAMQTQTVVAAAADRLAFVTPPRTIGAGACSAIVTVARRDPYGNDAPGAAATVGLTAAPAAGFAFYSDAACTIAVTSVPLPNGAAQASFYFAGTVAAGELLTASSSPLAPVTQAATVTAAVAPTQLVFTTPPRTIAANGCSAVLSVQSRDSFDNPRTVAAATPVTFAGAGATFYSNATCTVPVTMLSIPAMMDTVSFYFRATAAGMLPVSASASMLNPANQTEVVNPAPPDRLVFTSAPQTLTAGACSAAAAVEPRDAYGNVAPPASVETITLTGGAGLTFYTDAACTMAAGSVPLAGGAASASFFFRGTQAGIRTLSAAVTGWTAAAQNETVNAGGATTLAFSTPTRTVQAGACSAMLTVEAQDSFGNTTTVGVATNVTLGAAPGAGFTFHSDSGCAMAAGTGQIPAGGSSVSFYVRGTAVATVAVTATAAGLPAANQSVTVTPGNPSVIAFTTPARTAVVGTCAQVLTVQLEDAFGNVAVAGAGGVTLNLGAAPALGFTFHGNASCSMAGGTAAVPAGLSSASFYFSGTAAGTIALTVSGTGLSPANQSATVTPAAAASFSWDLVASPRAYNVPFGVTVRARDAFGNVATGFTGTAVIALTPMGTVSCTASCTNSTTSDTFSAGVWTGTVTITSAAAVGTNRALVAASGVISGTSNMFTVTGPAARSPPTARFTWSPVVVDTGGTVSFDASTSSDFQTAASQLQVRYDYENNGTWTAWSTTKTGSHRYDTAGLFRVSIQVRDTDGDLGYRSGWVRVLGPGDRRCMVNTASDVDDGASSCTSGFGTDGRLSLSEAVRLANAAAGLDYILFSGPMTITSTGSYGTSGDLDIYAQPGVILAGKSIALTGNGTQLKVYGLEMTGQAAPLDVSGNTATVVLTDAWLHDMAGITDSRGLVTLEQSRMSNCTGPCVQKTSTNPGLVTIRHSELRDSPAQSAVQFTACPVGNLLDMFSNTLTNFAVGVQVQCAGQVTVQHNTFEAVGTSVQLTGGTNNVLRNNIFSNNSVAAASCGTATFTVRSHHQLFGNASNGCLNGDPSTLTSDPGYAFASAGDLRLGFGSPAIDSAFDTGLDVCLGFPGNFLGGAPDRGGRESY